MTQKIVVIDPGHGGADPGAHGNDIIEASDTLCLGRRVTTRLRMVAGDYLDPVMVRTREDETLTHEERAARALGHKAEFAIVLHVNASHDPHAHGLLTFHIPEDPIGAKVAAVIARCAPPGLYRRDRAVWPAKTKAQDPDWGGRPRACIVQYQCPAVLVEVGYCSNDLDAKLLKLPQVRDGLCVSIEAGLLSVA